MAEAILWVRPDDTLINISCSICAHIVNCLMHNGEIIGHLLASAIFVGDALAVLHKGVSVDNTLRTFYFG